MTTRRERLERRAEQRRAWAEKAEARSDAAHDRVHQIADGIPFGQPILVGHHSERGARRDQARMESGMRTAVDESRKADRHEQAAGEIERQLQTSVFSDDEDAVARLTEILARLEAERDRWKAYNASCRRGDRDTSLLDEAQRESLLSLAKYAPYQLGKRGEVSYTNLSAMIRQKKLRIAEVSRLQAAAASGVRLGGRVMAARYVGECADCGGPIEKGTMMTWYRSTREAVHVSCPEPAEDQLQS